MVNSKIQSEIAENNKNFKKKEKIIVFELERVSYFSTVCQEHFEKKICHEHCGLAYQNKTDEQHFMSCAARGRNGKCRQCECSMAIHYHTYDIPREKETTVEKIINEMKIVYDDALSKKQKSDQDANQNSLLKALVEKDIKALKNTLLDNCKQLKSICNNFNFHEELQSFIETLRKEASISRDFQKQKEFNQTADAIEEILNSDEFSQKSSKFKPESDEEEDQDYKSPSQRDSNQNSDTDESDD